LRGAAGAARASGLLPLMAVLFLVQFVDRSFGPVLPLYVGELGTPEAAVASLSGTIISLAAVATGVSASVLGHLTGRFSVRHLLLVTLGAGVLLCLPLALVQSPLQLLLVRVLLGLFAGGSLTLVYALANQGVSAREKGAAFGVLSSVSLLGSASSPLVTGALAVVGLRSVFLLDGVLYGVALLWLAGSMRAPSEGRAPSERRASSERSVTSEQRRS
jgi:DHA1 family multidrug resistance protein-like MFS transporter